MPSHTHKHPLSAVARWTVPAALCSAGMMGAWLPSGPPARPRAAKPVSVIVARTRPKAIPATSKQPGQPGQVAGGRPNGHAAVAPPTKTITPEAFPYPYPYDSFTPAWALWRTYPYEVNGKLFFTN